MRKASQWKKRSPGRKASAKASCGAERGDTPSRFTQRIGSGQARAASCAQRPALVDREGRNREGLRLRRAHEALHPALITFGSRKIARSSFEACASLGRGLCYLFVRQRGRTEKQKGKNNAQEVARCSRHGCNCLCFCARICRARPRRCRV